MGTTGKRQYASGTVVGIGRSKDDIDGELRRVGALRRAFYDDEEARIAVVQFEREGVRYRLTLPLPDPKDDKYRWTPARRFTVDAARQHQAWQQDCAERWRALSAYIKALRVGWEAGIIKLEEALLSAAVLGTGQTVGEYILPQLPASLEAHSLPPLLPGVAAPESEMRQLSPPVRIRDVR